MRTTGVPAHSLGGLPKRRGISQSCRHCWENGLERSSGSRGTRLHSPACSGGTYFHFTTQVRSTLNAANYCKCSRAANHNPRLEMRRNTAEFKWTHLKPHNSILFQDLIRSVKDGAGSRSMKELVVVLLCYRLVG